ncbi:YggS family pyridoxal phosphate-dependent enzyme [Tsukamurella paurometabola]|uniref:Pyridoxal phosphate homeostasis protein n=1 Tax=Tsukamurella paurometabola TaxID=2061 RepID=A0ABS5NAU4_TSUPA|nr:YggS family pyridoxal phosphate-dependent enzyme [Tsukamurella paurometabola]MBS4101073.1 YggS family pyridoxal phosphate-dependent enzyme [Tsukamurella paurometabola]
MSSYPPAQTIAEFEANIAEVMRRIDAAAARAGRSPSDVRLLPVSKTVPQERLRLAVAAGCRELGENKVQEAKRKSAEMADLDVSWAVIGHLQTNKAKDVAAVAAEFQALDSVRVAEALDRRLQALGRGLDVYVQVNTSAEEQKYGLPPAEVPAFLDALPAYTSLRVRGFMTLAEFSSDEERVRACFRRLREVRDRAVQDGSEAVELSMGMSGDYEIAVEEGSTCVRVGQAIFGSRATPDSAYWPAGQ